MLNRFLALVLVAVCMNAQALTLSEYVKQVTGQNDSAVASDLTSRGALLRSGEGSLPFATNLYFNGDYVDDQRLTAAPAFQGSGTRVNRYEAGFSQKFRFGMDASLGYLQQKTVLQGVNKQLVRFYDYYDDTCQLKLTQ